MLEWLPLIWLLWVAVPIVIVVRVRSQRRAEIDAWERTPAGKRHREALESWLLCKARVEQAEPTGEPPVLRPAHEYRRRVGAGRVAQKFVREERIPMRLQVRLLPLAGGEVRTEAVIPILAAEVGDLQVGKIFSVLHDPNDPRRFWVDTTRRDGVLIDAITMRTRAAEENHRAAQAFSTGQS